MVDLRGVKTASLCLIVASCASESREDTARVEELDSAMVEELDAAKAIFDGRMNNLMTDCAASQGLSECAHLGSYESEGGKQKVALYSLVSVSAEDINKMISLPTFVKIYTLPSGQEPLYGGM